MQGHRVAQHHGHSNNSNSSDNNVNTIMGIDGAKAMQGKALP